MNLNEWEKVKMFRCVQDPMVGPKPRNAFMLPDLPNWEAWYNTHTGSVYVKVPTTLGIRHHVIPTGNLSSLELERDVNDGKTQDQSGKRSKKDESQKSGAV